MAINIGAIFNIQAKIEGQEQLDAFGKKLDETGKKANQMGQQAGTSAKQTAQAFRMLPAQMTDVVTQLSGGASPFLVLIQQGGQVKDSFGGIAPMFRAFATALGPVGVAAVGVAAAFAAMVAPIAAGYFEQQKFQRDLLVTANYAGMTAQKFNELAASISKASGVRIGVSKDLLGGAVASGAFGVQSIESVARAMANVQRLSGQTADEVVKDFAGMSRGVANWAAEHNRQYNFLTLDVYKQIDALERQGRQEEAMKLASDQLNRSLQDRREDLGFLETAWKNVKEAASGAWEAMKGWGKESTTGEQIQAKRAEILALQDQMAAVQKMRAVGPGAVGKQRFMEETPQKIIKLTQEIALLQALEKGQQDRAAAEAKKAADERQKIEDEKSGRLYNIDAAAGAKRLAELQRQNQVELNAIQKQQAELDNVHAQGLISDAEYSQRKLDIRGKELQAQAALIQQEIAIAQSKKVRDGDDAGALQRDAQVLALKKQLLQVEGQIANIPIEKQTEKSKADTAEVREKAKAWADVVKSAQDYARSLNLNTARQKVDLDEVSPLERARKQAEIEVQEIKRLAKEQLDQLQLQLDMAITPGAKEAVLQQIEDVKKARDDAVDVTTRKAVPETAWKGASRAIAEYVDDAKNAGRQVQQFMTQAFAKIEDTMVDGFMTGKFAFADMARSIIADLIRITVRALILKPIMESIGSMMGGGGGFGGGFGILSLFGFAKGGAFGAGRDVVSSPTLFKFADGGSFRSGVMGEAGPEAIMPLKRGPDGRLGVQANGTSGGGDVNVSVVVNANSSQVGGDAQGGQLGQMIASAVSAILIKEKRPGGLLSPV